MAEPGDEIAAAASGRGHLRASHADRERVIDTLKAAFVQGRLTKDEFDARIGHTFASRTYTELAAARRSCCYLVSGLCHHRCLPTRTIKSVTRMPSGGHLGQP